MSDVIFISNARISFPNLATPQKNVDSEGKERISYNCDLLLPPNDPGYVAFMKRYSELAVEKWQTNAQQAMQMIHSDRKQRCYGDGNEKVNKKTFQPYTGYAGHAYLSVGSKNPPQMIQADGKPVDSLNTMAWQAVARKVYGGCYANVAIKPWLQSNKHGNGIRCDLIAVQFAKDGEAFGEGAVDASGLFGAVAAAPSVAAPVANMGLPPFLTQ